MTLMTCPDEGTLRAFLDRADDDHEALAAHVRGCLECRRAVRTLRLNADTVSSALAVLDDDMAAPAVAGVVDRSHEAIDPPVRTRRWGRLATGAAAVALTVGLIITPAGQAVAGGLLNLFHSRSVAAVTLTNSDASQVAAVMSELGLQPSNVSARPYQVMAYCRWSLWKVTTECPPSGQPPGLGAISASTIPGAASAR